MDDGGPGLFDLTGDMSAPMSGQARQAPAGRCKVFRDYDPGAGFLLPPSLDEWLRADDEARFIGEVVDGMLDLSGIHASYEKLRGAPPYDPAMMLKVLIYAYSNGITSSRGIERACRRDIAFRWLTANQTPDYRSLARFRRRHLEVMAGLFTQVLAICARAGLVSLGRVALDGTKLSANASRHKAMSYGRMEAAIAGLQDQVDAMLADAEATDTAEDARPPEPRTPGRLADQQRRLAALRAVPEPRAQRNFTDPDARIMKTAAGGFGYCYNGQAVVDQTAQVIVAAEVTTDAGDVGQPPC